MGLRLVSKSIESPPTDWREFIHHSVLLGPRALFLLVSLGLAGSIPMIEAVLRVFRVSDREARPVTDSLARWSVRIFDWSYPDA